MSIIQNNSFKLSPPYSSGPWLKRERLLHYISTVVNRKLVLVTAPAGYGKTIFLTQWYEQCRQDGVACTWLTLDKSDNDRLQFIHSLLLALRSINSEIGNYTQQLLDSQVEPDLDDIINHLCGDFGSLEKDTVIVLDDYDRADAPGINEILEILLCRTPPYVQFLIAARKQPGLPVARLQLQNTCTVISVEALRFSVAEVSAFFKRLHQLEMADDEVELLIEKSEGWIAGLQLVMLAAKNRQSGKALPGSLSGDFRDIADYLVSDVLSQLPETLQEFLIKSSVLNKLNAELCEILTGRSDSQQILEQMESANLFLMPVGETREWYRYHQLFREFLLFELQKSDVIDSADLYRRASLWFEQNDMPEDAVNYALKAKDNERAIRLVETFAEQMIRHGQIRQVISWINGISPELTRNRVRLSMIQIWALFHLGRTTQGQQILQEVKSQVDNLKNYSDTDYSREQFDTECLTLEACLAVASEDLETIKAMTANPQPLSNSYPFLSGTYANALAAGSFSLGLLDDTIKFAELGYAQFAAPDSTYGKVFAECLMGLVAMTRGKLGDAMLHFGRGEQLALADIDGDSYCCGLARCLKGSVFYLQYNMDEARRLLDKNLPLVSGHGYAEIWRLASLTRASLLAADQQWNQADEVFKRDLLDQSRDWARHSVPMVIDEWVRIAIQAGDLIMAERQALQYGVSLHSAVSLPTQWQINACSLLRIRIRLCLAHGQAHQALEISEHLLDLLSQTGQTIQLLEMRILQALAQAALRKSQDACDSLIKAVELALPETIIAPFLEGGDACAELVRTLISGGVDKKYLDFLQGIDKYFNRYQYPAGTENLAANLQHGLCLTNREQDVLELLADGIENRIIAEQLSISEHTVKWHVRNILDKFGASNRMKAVLIAREEGYL